MAAPAEGTLEAIPGDPAALYEAADEMDRTARDFEDAADSIGAHGRQVTANWYGDASEAAGEHIRGLSTRVRVGDDVYAGVAKVIRTYAAALATAQDAWSDAATRAGAASAALGQAHTAAAAAAAMPTTDASGQVDYAAASAQAIAADDAAAAVRSAGAALSAAQEDMTAAVAAALAANTDAARQVEAFTDQLAAMGAMGGQSTSGVGASTAAAVGLAEGARVTGATSGGVQQGWDGSVDWADGDDEDDADGGQSWWDSPSDEVREALGQAEGQVQSVLDFYRDHPDVLARTVRDAGLTALGAVLLAEGVGGELGGVALDATGIGALAGGPINVAEAGVIAAGAGSALAGGVGLSQDIKAVLEGRQVPTPSSALDDGTMAAQHSATLGKNLEASGAVRPAGTAAHHIVAWNSPAAAPARAVLQKFGIDIDDADNGVFLPTNKNSPSVTSGASVHASLHTDTYYKTVNELLPGAKSKTDAEAALARLRVALQNGWAPR